MKGPRTKCPNCGKRGISLCRRAWASSWSDIVCEICGTQFRHHSFWFEIGSAYSVLSLPLAIVAFFWSPWRGVGLVLAILILLLGLSYTAFVPLVEKKPAPSPGLNPTNIALNLRLLFNLLAKWSRLTIAIAVGLGGLNAYYLTGKYGFTPAEIAVAIVGVVAAMAFLKASVLIMTYPFFNKSAFEGSLFVTALLVAILPIAAIGCAAILLAPRTDSFPTAEMIWLLPLVFAIISKFLFDTFRLAHWMFAQ